MFRAVIISVVVHIFFFVSLIGVYFILDEPESQWFEVYHVKSVSPQLIEERYNRPDAVDKPDLKNIPANIPQKPLSDKQIDKSRVTKGVTAVTEIMQSSERELFECDISMATSVNKWNVKNDISCGIAPVIFAPGDEFGGNDIALDINPVRLNESYENFMVQDAYTLIKDNLNNDNFIILDVRTPKEYAGGHLENAINIDFFSSSFQNSLAALDKDKTYLIYCRSGKRSFGAMQIMNTLDFRKVYNMINGIEAWVMKELPTTNNIATFTSNF
ncbi:rhodanese-like domain-containing protein [Candidatus Latescibacterota bacterium]